MSQDLEQRGTSAIRRVPVPAVLAEVGVQIATDEAGNRVVMIPRSVRERVNVIDPVSSLVQADPNWTPRISLCELDARPGGTHFYNQGTEREPKLAPTKQALETLAKAAGVLYTKTERIPRAELDTGEIGYRAKVGIRRSDGTVEELTRDRIWVEAAERAEIEEAVGRSDFWEWDEAEKKRVKRGKFMRGTAAFDAEVTKRWLKELKDRSSKTESKAVNRAIRAALQIGHTFTAEEAAKPFLIIGFNFTPDYSDAETRRLLVAAGLNAGQALYGSTPALDPAATPEEGRADGGEPAQAGAASQTGPLQPATGPQDARGGTVGAPAAASPGTHDDDPEPGTTPPAGSRRSSAPGCGRSQPSTATPTRPSATPSAATPATRARPP